MRCPYCNKPFILPKEESGISKKYGTDCFWLRHKACGNKVYVEVEKVVKVKPYFIMKDIPQNYYFKNVRASRCKKETT